MEISKAIIEMTTRSSMRVNARCLIVTSPKIKGDRSNGDLRQNGFAADDGSPRIFHPAEPNQGCRARGRSAYRRRRSEEHTSELQSLMRTPYAALCAKKK